jgi:hypothetical protein
MIDRTWVSWWGVASCGYLHVGKGQNINLICDHHDEGEEE